MGSISSVSMAADYRGGDELDEDSAEESASTTAVSSESARQGVVEVQQRHSLRAGEEGVEKGGLRRERVGIGALYLAEENARLGLLNRELEREVEQLRGRMEVGRGAEDPDAIYGESVERRMQRLEKHLASEREEKWSAIERSERTRVALVNCERELGRSREAVERLGRELEGKKRVIEELEGRGGRGGGGERGASLGEFREELRAKREARRRALSALSQEMSGLREEVRAERAWRRRLEEEAERRGGEGGEGSVAELLSDNASLRNEIGILTENVERLKGLSAENVRLRCEAQRRNEEMDSLNESLGELKFEYYEEKRKHERAVRRLREMEERAESRGEWEREREELQEKYEREKEAIERRTRALREVVAITKQMLGIREGEVEELKKRLREIEEAVKRSRMTQEDGLKAEYEKQLENIKKLRELYEERVKLMESEREKLQESLEEKSRTIEEREREMAKLAGEAEAWREETRAEKHEKESVERELRLTMARTKDLENEIVVMNNTFTQMLLGPYNSGNETDLDRLTELLQENHELIAEMTTREDGSEMASVLPKLLLDLITQVDGGNDRREEEVPESSDTISEQSEGLLEEHQGAVLPILSYKDATLFKPSGQEEGRGAGAKGGEEGKAGEQIDPAVQEIASNLPKVWRVLMELLSHHSAPEEPTPGDEKQCYKNVETPNGPRTVISVSKTFIRLKDLILEKKALQKELTRLKQLNSHLEIRLDDQEKRLSQVQCELHKTWGIVGRMRAQHQQLHNNEKILRFELQEKRVMLSELKQELEYCRDKWERARQKNDESETEWKKLRREFAARKTKGNLLSNLNDSGESGFSDEQNESGEDGENFDADRSSTQSPVDSSLLGGAPGEVDLAEEIIQRSKDNLRQTRQNVERTRLEECTEVQATTSRARGEEEERARAREARDLRLRRLEEQCKLLVRQVDITTHKSNYLSNRLEELHEQYGSGEDSRRQGEGSAGTSRAAEGGAPPGTDCEGEQSPPGEGPSN